jgi:hypothetical protein
MLYDLGSASLYFIRIYPAVRRKVRRPPYRNYLAAVCPARPDLDVREGLGTNITAPAKVPYWVTAEDSLLVCVGNKSAMGQVFLQEDCHEPSLSHPGVGVNRPFWLCQHWEKR